MPHELGQVKLVGAGPGAADLMTVRALRAVEGAQALLYDALISDEVLALAPARCLRIQTGKRAGKTSMPQDVINGLMLKLARRGLNVVRLKGGDPFIFGRGGEEIDRLAEARIPFQVIPGITAASGCACYAGIPLTHRDYSQSVRFVTGHLKNDTIDLDWPTLACENQTVVFYMGLVGLEVICAQLIAHGMAADMPIALVQQGTTANQKVLTGTLESMPALVAANEIQAPTIIIVGRVVKLQPLYSWFGG